MLFCQSRLNDCVYLCQSDVYIIFRNMIQRPFITQWGTVVPWTSPRHVEQDLIISRALVTIYNDAFLRDYLAFRGGTALHKLYLQPQPRYSEDIDLVQVNAEPIKNTIDHLRDILSWLGEPVVKQKKHNNTLQFRVQPTTNIFVSLQTIHLLSKNIHSIWTGKCKIVIFWAIPPASFVQD